MLVVKQGNMSVTLFECVIIGGMSNFWNYEIKAKTIFLIVHPY